MPIVHCLSMKFGSFQVKVSVLGGLTECHIIVDPLQDQKSSNGLYSKRPYSPLFSPLLIVVRAPTSTCRYPLTLINVTRYKLIQGRFTVRFRNCVVSKHGPR